MSIPTAVAAVSEALANWLNPERREKVVLRGAIESAKELLLILRKKGRYAFFSEKKLKQYEEHFQKRFDAWQDGQ